LLDDFLSVDQAIVIIEQGLFELLAEGFRARQIALMAAVDFTAACQSSFSSSGMLPLLLFEVLYLVFFVRAGIHGLQWITDWK